VDAGAGEHPAVGVGIGEPLPVEGGPVLLLQLLAGPAGVLKFLHDGGAAARVRVHAGPDGKIEKLP